MVRLGVWVMGGWILAVEMSLKAKALKARMKAEVKMKATVNANVKAKATVNANVKAKAQVRSNGRISSSQSL